MKSAFLLALIFLSFFFAACDEARSARLDIPFEFSTIDTEHFEVHFHQGLNDAAQRAAVYAEEAYSLLLKDFKWASVGKTHVVLVDDSDSFSASSVAVPYNAVFIHAAPPSSGFPTLANTDWLRAAVLREYAKVVTSDLSDGYSKAARNIFGKPAPAENPFSLAVSIAAGPPGSFLPNWLKDGVSGWEEERYAGPGKNSYREMVLRMAVLEDDIPSPDALNGENPRWPGEYLPYAFGTELVSHIAEKYGIGAVGELVRRHSGRFPFFLNGAPEAILGKDYPALYSEMIEALREREEKAAREIRENGITPVKELGIEGEALTEPRFSPDGRLLAVNRHDPGLHDTVLILEDGKTVDAVRRLSSGGSISWGPDGKSVFFCQEEVNSGFYVYQDLYEHTLADKKTKRLTFGMRVREADLSPDGRSFAVVVNNRASQNLAILDAERKTDGTLYEKTETVTDYALARVAGPRWSPDGSLIAYTVLTNDGRSRLFVYSPREKRHTELYGGGFLIESPAWSKKGDFIVFVSDASGVYDLYAYSLKEGTVFKVTNLAGGAFQPDIADDGSIVFSSYNSHGFKIAVAEFRPKELKPIAVSTGIATEDNKPPNEKIEEGSKNAPGRPRPFSPADTLVPRFWLPALSGDRDGTVIGAYTAATDVLEYNAYQAEIDYGPASGRFYYDASYVNDYWYPTFTIEARSKPFLYSNFMGRGNYYELQRSYSARVAVPLNSVESRYTFTAGYNWLRQSALSDLTDGKFENMEVFRGRRSNIYLGIEFSNQLKYPLSISPEEGRTVSVQYKKYSKASGSMVDSNEYTVSYSEYLSLFPESLSHNVLCLNFKGGASAGDRISQEAFQIGGYPGQSDFPLRGFRSRFEAGKYVATGTAEYRAPLSYLYRGWDTKPLFMEKLHGAFFAETGETWGDGSSFRAGRLRTGAGFEARLDMNAGYRFKVTPALGIARGFGPDGETIAYFYISSLLGR